MKKTKTSPPAPGRLRAHGGRLTLPKSVVSRITDHPDDTTFVVQPMGDGVFLIPEDKMSPAMDAMLQFRRTADEAGVTLQDLLEGLDEEGDAYTREVYGK